MSAFRFRCFLPLCLLLVALMWLPACGGSPKARPRATAEVTPISRDVPTILRDTIGAQVTFRGNELQLVSGYGLVVNLDGTGSSDVPIGIRAIMEREMAILGVGSELGGFSNMTPGQLIDHPSTAVVIVSGVLPPAAPANSRIDVRVHTLPGTSTSSLEGGLLYTTDLRKGLVTPDAPNTDVVARARGPVFINPFANPDGDTETVDRTVGRILNGGWVTETQELLMYLDTPSHSRARAMASAINARFPNAYGREATARGRNEELVIIKVPLEFATRTREFVEIIRHLRVDQAFPQEWAQRYVEALKEYPELAEDLSCCLKSLGSISLPFIRPMYEYGEVRPRMAALDAGAWLKDPTTEPYLRDLAMTGPPAIRTNALRLMAYLDPDPSINQFLLEMLDADDIDVRVAAFESLDKRGDLRIRRTRVGEKFELLEVPCNRPMIYVTQQGIARVVLFGSKLELLQPSLVTGWDNRLMIRADSPGEAVEVFFRDHRTSKITRTDISPDVVSLVRFLAHQTTPEEPAPGLDMTYSEVVGALYEVYRDGALDALFVPESDRLALEFTRTALSEFLVDRPELSEEGAVDELPGAPVETQSDQEMDAAQREAERERRRSRYVVPTGNQPATPLPEPDDPDLK